MNLLVFYVFIGIFTNLEFKLFVRNKTTVFHAYTTFKHACLETIKSDCLYQLSKYQQQYFLEILKNIENLDKSEKDNPRGILTNKYGVLIYQILRSTINNLKSNGCPSEISEQLSHCLENKTALIFEDSDENNSLSKDISSESFYELNFEKIYLRLRNDLPYRFELIQLSSDLLIEMYTKVVGNLNHFISFLRFHFLTNIEKYDHNKLHLWGKKYEYDVYEALMGSEEYIEYPMRCFSLSFLKETISNIFCDLLEDKSSVKLILFEFSFNNFLYAQIIKYQKIYKLENMKKIIEKLKNIVGFDAKESFPDFNTDKLTKTSFNIMLDVTKEYSFDVLYGKLSVYFDRTGNSRQIDYIEKSKDVIDIFVEDTYRLFTNCLLTLSGPKIANIMVQSKTNNAKNPNKKGTTEVSNHILSIKNKANISVVIKSKDGRISVITERNNLRIKRTILKKIEEY